MSVARRSAIALVALLLVNAAVVAALLSSGPSGQWTIRTTELRDEPDASGDLTDLPSASEIFRIQGEIQRDARRADPTGKAGAGGRAVAYRAGGRAIRSSSVAAHAPEARLFRTGYLGLEPTLGVNRDGWVFIQAAAQNAVFFETRVLRSHNGGRAWVDISPRLLGGIYQRVYTEDPYLFLDQTTGRLFTDDLILPCQLLSYTDNGGVSWATHPVACEITDHQTIFAGPAPAGGAKPSGYPNVIYDCAIGIGVASPTSLGTSCVKSLDGGATFTLTGAPAYGPNPGAEDGTAGVPGVCDGATGHGFVGSDGTVYLPRGWCGQPYVAISKDEGASWTRVQVANNGFNAGGDGDTGWDHEASVVADRAGNLYYLWIAHDYRPYLALSHDGGKTWSKPMMIAPPGVTQAALPALAIGPKRTPGRIAFVFMGSTNAPRDPYPRDEDRYAGVRWNAYMGLSVDALRADPIFYAAAVNDPRDALVEGACGPVRCHAEYDFIDVQVGFDGTPWAVMVDACFDGRCSPLGEDIVGRLVGGPSLR
ncbi:MAG: sialidase family protein [Actinomycetota bacterium]